MNILRWNKIKHSARGGRDTARATSAGAYNGGGVKVVVQIVCVAGRRDGRRVHALLVQVQVVQVIVVPGSVGLGCRRRGRGTGRAMSIAVVGGAGALTRGPLGHALGQRDLATRDHGGVCVARQPRGLVVAGREHMVGSI